MAAQNKLPTYGKPHRLLVAAPLLLAVAAVVIIVSGNFVPLGLILLLLMLIITVTNYVKQFRYLRQVNQTRRVLFQVYSTAGALFVPYIATVAGDLAGAHTYGTPMTLGGDVVGLIIGAIIAAVWLYGCVVANEVHIGRKSASVALNVLAKVFTVIAYVVIAAISWIAYGVTYSLHDPSTE